MNKDYVKKLISQLTADKKKLSIMVGLFAVAMLMWGRLLLERVPRTATAEPTLAVVSASPGETAADGTVIRPVIWVDPTDPLHRDLFLLNPAEYVRVAVAEDTTVRVAKSDHESVDEIRVAEAVREAASRLTLQSIIQGARPRAMINGQLLAPGQTVEGFVVTRIDQRHVLLTKNGVNVPLVMD
jgi:hypothetical protein